MELTKFNVHLCSWLSHYPGDIVVWMRKNTWLEFGCVQLAFGFSFLSTCVHFLDMDTTHGRVSDEIIVCLISIRVCLLNEPR